jgi:hypothetical protein
LDILTITHLARSSLLVGYLGNLLKIVEAFTATHSPAALKGYLTTTPTTNNLVISTKYSGHGINVWTNTTQLSHMVSLAVAALEID